MQVILTLKPNNVLLFLKLVDLGSETSHVVMEHHRNRLSANLNVKFCFCITRVIFLLCETFTTLQDTTQVLCVIVNIYYLVKIARYVATLRCSPAGRISGSLIFGWTLPNNWRARNMRSAIQLPPLHRFTIFKVTGPFWGWNCVCELMLLNMQKKDHFVSLQGTKGDRVEVYWL